MITVKYFTDSPNGRREIVWFRRKNSDLMRWYYKDGESLQAFLNSDLSSEYDFVDNVEGDILRGQAVQRGMLLMKKYYVTPPDFLDWTYGSYIYYPDGQCVHIDPKSYGEDGIDSNPDKDVTEKIIPLYAPTLAEII